MNGPENRRYQMKGRVVLRRIGTDTLLVPVSGRAAGGRVFPVNATAECIWNCLSQGGTPAEAADRMVEQFNVDREEALADCLSCAAMLCEEQLVEEAP